MNIFREIISVRGSLHMKSLLAFGTFNGERVRGIDLNGLSLAEFVDRPEDVITRHTHESAHFQFLLRGSYITSAKGLEGICSSPAVIFNPAGTTHHDRFHTRGGAFLTLSVAPALADRVGSHCSLKERAVGFSSGEMLWLGARLCRELRRLDEVSPIVIEGLALELLANVSRQHFAHKATSVPSLSTAFQQIQDCYREKLTLQKIAAAVGVQSLVLGRSFRKAFGCSAGEMLRQRRVARAEELLRQRDLPLTEIALASGFADQAQLTKAFRRVTGLTPAAYRRTFST
jgi:AraC family transcriptional regulator